MSENIRVDIDLLQPSDKALSERKLARIRFLLTDPSYNPKVVIAPFMGRYAIIDGNHGTYIFYESGKKDVDATLRKDLSIEWIRPTFEMGIKKLSDLSDRILAHDEWRKRYDFSFGDEDDLSDAEFFRLHPEIRKYCRYLNK